MGVYLVKGKGWRFDFTLKGARYSGVWFETKAKAKKAEATKREEVEAELKMPQSREHEDEAIDMAFLDLVNLRLDHVQSHNSERHYEETCYMARRWVVK